MDSFAPLVAYAAALAIAAVIPGPGVAALVGQALGRGLRPSLFFLGGIALGDVVWLTVAIAGLAALAAAHDIPLIVDGAYGLPFPGMVYTAAQPTWNEHLVLCLSLSKFGLPACRTGIVIARPELIRALAGMNAVVNLAPSSFGARLTADLVRTGEILRLGREVIRPCYQRKRDLALTAVAESFAGLPYRVHVPEGAFFLWLWFPGLPITSRALYERLKARGVLVVSGDWFFPGLAAGWSHTDECLRLTYSQDEAEVRRGIALIADEIRRIFPQPEH